MSGGLLESDLKTEQLSMCEGFLIKRAAVAYGIIKHVACLIISSNGIW